MPSSDVGVFVQQSATPSLTTLTGADLGVYVTSAPAAQQINDFAGTDLGVWLSPQSEPLSVNPLTSLLLGVVSGEPAVVSLSPNQANPGAAFTLSINGINLFNASAVSAEPPDGVSFTSAPSVTADGLQLTVGVSIESAATSGPRVIRVTTPRGTSSSTAATGNVLTINTP